MQRHYSIKYTRWRFTQKVSKQWPCGFMQLHPFLNKTEADWSIFFQYTDRTSPMDKHMEVMINRYGMVAAPPAAQMFGNAGREHMEKYGKCCMCWMCVDSPLEFRPIFVVNQTETHTLTSDCDCNRLQQYNCCAVVNSVKFNKLLTIKMQSCEQFVGMKNDTKTTTGHNTMLCKPPGTKPEHFAKIAWKNHKHSTNNP